MRVAIVSDIHGNLVALDAVIADIATVSPDVVLQAGDLAVTGPRPADVVDRVRELRWAGVVGNTDELIAVVQGGYVLARAQRSRAPFDAAIEGAVSLLHRATA